MRKNYFLYHGKYSNTYRIASAEDTVTINTLLSEGWMRTTLAEVRSLRQCGVVADKIAVAYIDASGVLVIVEPD